MCINSVVKAEVQLQWCELQTYQLCKTESAPFTGELEALPYCQTCTNQLFKYPNVLCYKLNNIFLLMIKQNS